MATVVLVVVAAMGLAAVPFVWWLDQRGRDRVRPLPPLIIPLPPPEEPGTAGLLARVPVPLLLNRGPATNGAYPVNGTRAVTTGRASTNGTHSTDDADSTNGSHSTNEMHSTNGNGGHHETGGNGHQLPSRWKELDLDEVNSLFPIEPSTPPPLLRGIDFPIERFIEIEPDDADSRFFSALPLDGVHDMSETLRFYRPGEHTVQLLPGRLVVVAGAGHREIRFVRIPGQPPHLILGREAGSSPAHVGLGSPTVSRRHARLDYANGQWEIRNLSQTNPLVVNDELSDTDVARPLVDGDRLELGEVVLRFHSH
jgi:FHA domain